MCLVKGHYTKMPLLAAFNMIQCRQCTSKLFSRASVSLLTSRWSSTTTTTTVTTSVEQSPKKNDMLLSISPTELTSDHVSKIYCLPKEEMKTVFPQGLPRKFSNLANAVGRGCWIFREQSYNIINSLQSMTPETATNTRYLLYGKDGCGKSICLSQVIHWCVKSGWLVIHIPSVFSWTHSREDTRSSSKHPETFDQPNEAALWLKNFKTTNSTFINKMSLSSSHTWTKRDSSEKDDPLAKVIEQGLLKPNIATDIVGVVLEEIIRVADRYKLLLAVDDFNGCFNPTSLRPNKTEWLEAKQLNLVKYVTDLTSHGKFPGAVVLALSKTKMYRHHVPSCEPQPLLGDKGMECVDGYEFFEVPGYHREEMNSCVQYYNLEKWFNKAFTPQVAKELWHLSHGNPAEVYRLCTSL